MLDKLKFNNLVISNKKSIQQSHIQTINKLVHKIRRLKKSLETKPDNGKLKIRLRVNQEIIAILKKLKRMDIIKKVLLFNANPMKVLTNGRAMPEEIAVALLATNSILQKLIKTFKVDLSLSDADDAWRDEIMQLSKRRERLSRIEEKRQKRQEMKQQRDMEKKRLSWLESNNPNAAKSADSNDDDDDDDDGADDDVNNAVKKQQPSTVGSWIVEELSEEEQASTSVPKAMKTKTPQKKLQKLENKTSKTQIESNDELQQQLPTKLKKIQNESLIVNKQLSKTKTFKSEETLKLSDSKPAVKSATTLKEELEQEMEIEVPAEVTHVVDPFFITNTGENYLSTAVAIKQDEPEGKSSNDNEMWKSNNLWKGGRERANNKQAPIRREKYTQHDVRQNIIKEHKLHPSWAAKQMMKPTISKFQGKKIVFGDNDVDAVHINAAKQNNSFAKPEAAADKLHPSWAAKQKLKPVIAAFQGTKKKFDEDD